MNKQGQIRSMVGMGMGLFIFMVIAIVIVVVFIMVQFGFGLVTTNLTNIPAPDNITNISKYAGITFGNLNLAAQQLKWIGFVIIFSMVLGLIVAGYTIKSKAWFFFFWLMIMGIAVVVSIPISKAYEAMYNSGGAFGAAVQSNVGSSWILLNLPLWVTIVGFVAGGLMMIRTRTPEETEGSV